MPLSKSQKGAIFEIGLSNLTLLLSGGELQLATNAVDGQDVDRVLIRPLSGRARFLQLKARTAPVTRGTLELHFDEIADAGDRPDLYLVAGELLPHSPWVGPRFAFIPAPTLPPPHRGRVNISIPLRRGSRSRWARYVHDRADLAAVLAERLDATRTDPYSVPPWEPRPHTALSSRARGHLIEREVAAAVLYHGQGRLNLWSPLVDDFGEDFAVTDRSRAAAVRVQPKGSVGLDRQGRIDVKVRRATFHPREFDYLVFANYDATVPALGAWVFVLRADEFADRARRQGEVLRFAARPDPAGAGKWRPWLYRSHEVAGLLEAALAVRRAKGAAAKLPSRRGEVAKLRHRARFKMAFDRE